MLSYIANNSTSDLIKTICQELNITILNHEVEEIDFLKYVKETKVNFSLIKYFVIDLNQLKNTDDEISIGIKYFKEMYVNTRIIVIAKDYDNQNVILTNLYENEIYNIINEREEQQIKEKIKGCLSQKGLQEKDSRKFKKLEEISNKKSYKELILRLNKINLKRLKEKIQANIKQQNQVNSTVYFSKLLLEVVKKLMKALYYITILVLAAIGLKILFDNELRNMVFQILVLK